MMNTEWTRKRIVGGGDTVWILIVAVGFGVIVASMVGHLRTQFEIYRLGNELAQLNAERAELLEERDRLLTERQVRADAVDLSAYAQSELGMAPVESEQVIRMEER